MEHVKRYSVYPVDDFVLENANVPWLVTDGNGPNTTRRVHFNAMTDP